MGVPRMAAQFYEKYFLISRPHYDKGLRAWVPYVRIYWGGDEFYHHALKEVVERFETQEEALAFGFSAARLWLDEHKSD
jgi:hypothetical protein